MNSARRWIIAGIVLCAGISGWRVALADDPPQKVLRYMPNEAFGVGEKLTFDVSFGFIVAGQATMMIDPDVQIQHGHRCYHIRFDVASSKSFDWLYRVHDHYDTYVDIDGIYPVRFEQHVREGGYSRDFVADFDQAKHVATTSDNMSFPIPEFVHDILSAYYFVRTMDLKSMHKDEEVQLQNFYKDKAHELGVRIRGRQDVEVGAGTFHCVIVEPMVKEGGLFKSDGRILIWLTDDDRKIPVKVSTKVVIGSIDAVMTSYAGTRGPVTAKVP